MDIKSFDQVYNEYQESKKKKQQRSFEDIEKEYLANKSSNPTLNYQLTGKDEFSSKKAMQEALTNRYKTKLNNDAEIATETPVLSEDEYQTQKKQLKSEKKQATKNYLGSVAYRTALSIQQNNNDPERQALLEEAMKLVRENKDKKNSYRQKLTDLENRRWENNFNKATEQLNSNPDLKSKIAQYGNLETVVEQNRKLQNNSKAAIQAESDFKKVKDELENGGYDINALLDAYNRPINAENQKQIDIATAEATKDHAGAYNAMSVVANGLSGVMGAGEYVKAKIREWETGEPQKVDTNSAAFVFQNARDTIRDTTSKEILKNIDNQTAANVSNFLYQTGMSVADFLSVSWLPQPVSLALMGTNAGTSAATDVVKKGGTTDQALMTGLAAGAAEVVFEKLSLENFNALKATGKSGLKNRVFDILKQMGTEGSEEAFTDIANAITDNLINGNMSDYNLAVQQYIDSGISPEEARKKANQDFAKQVALDFAGGALSGGVVGGAGVAINVHNNTNLGKQILNSENSYDMVKSLSERGLNADQKSDSYRIASSMGDVETKAGFSGREIGNLYNAVQADTQTVLNETAVNDYRNALLEKGADEYTAERNAPLLVKAAQGQKLTSAEARMIKNNQQSLSLFLDVPEGSKTPAMKLADIMVLSKSNDVEQVGGIARYETQKAAQVNIQRAINQKKASIIPVDNLAATKDGKQELKINGIAGADNGKLTLNVTKNDGSTTVLNLADVKINNPATALLYHEASVLPESEAKVYVQSYLADQQNGGTSDPAKYFRVFKAAQEAGRSGAPISSLANIPAIQSGAVTSKGVTAAYISGQTLQGKAQTADYIKDTATKINEETNGNQYVFEAAKKNPEFFQEKTKEKPKRKSKSPYKPGLTMEVKHPLSDIEKTQVEILDGIAKEYGVSVVAVEHIDSKTDAFGMYEPDSDTIYINLNKADGAMSYVAGHEFVHYISTHNPQGYLLLKDTVIQALEEAGLNVDEEIKRIKELYAKRGVEVDGEAVYEEIVANSCFDVFTNEQAVEHIAKQNRTLAQQMKDWFNDFLSKLKVVAERFGRKLKSNEFEALNNQIAALEEINQAFYNALEGTKNSATESDGVKYMLAGKDEKGIEVYKTTSETKKMSLKEKKIKLANLIRSEYRGRTARFEKGSQVYYAQLDRDSASKAVYGDKKSDRKGYAAKINIGVEGGYFDLVENARYTGSSLEIGKLTNAHKDVKSWDYFVKTIRSDSLYYDVLINVKDKGNNQFVYDITLNEQKKQQIPREATTKAALKNEVSTDNTNISQSETDVNNHSMQNSSKNVRYMINPDFNREYDKWDGKQPEIHFNVGKTSEVLKSVGVKGKEIIWDASKIIKTKAKHSNMTDEIIKQVPYILENPVVIMNSLSHQTRLTMFGEVYDKAGKPVLAVLELQPTTANKIALDEIKIASTYGKDNPQSLIDRSKILYVDPDKKRTSKWLSSNRLQLPVGENHTGSINRISYNENSVNSHSMQKSEKDTRYMLPTYESDEADLRLYDSYQRAMERNSSLQEAIKALDAGRNTLSGRQIRESTVREIANKILGEYASKYSKGKLTEELTGLYRKLEKDKISSDNLIYQGLKIASEIIDKSTKKTHEVENATKELRQKIHNTPISLTSEQKREVQWWYGSYENFRRAMFGKVTFTDSGTPLNEIWNDFVETDGGFFLDASTREWEQPMVLTDFLELTKARYDGGAPLLDDNAFALALSMQFYHEYFNSKDMRIFNQNNMGQKRVAYHNAIQGFKRNEQIMARDEMQEMRKTAYQNADNAMHQFAWEKNREMYFKMDKQKSRITTQTEQALLKQKVHYQELQKNSRTRRKQTEMRQKIKKVHNRLFQMLKQNSPEKHVPIELIKSVVNMLEVINMDTLNANERLNALQSLINEASDPVAKQLAQEEYNKLQAKDDRLKARLLDMEKVYKQLKGNGDYMQENMYDESIGQDIADLKQVIGDTPINKLSLDQLEQVYTVIREVEHTVQNANKLFKDGQKETIEESGKKALSELQKQGAKSHLSGKPAKAIRSFSWSLLKPLNAFRIINSDTLLELYTQVQKGEEIYAQDIAEARQKVEETYRKYHYNTWDLKKTHEFKTNKGEALNLTIGEIASIYFSFLRDGERGHLEGGGFLFNHEISDKAKGSDGKLKGQMAKLKSHVDTTPHQLNADDIIRMVDILSDEQLAFYKEMQRYLADVNGKKGNEVSRRLYGIDMYNDPFYFPFKSKDNYLNYSGETQIDPKIKNKSFTKSRVKGANNPIVIEDFMEVWARSCNDMALYHGLTLPMEDFNKVFNYKPHVNMDYSVVSIQQQLDNVFGEQAKKYIQRLMTDINGGVRARNDDGKIPDKMIALFKKNAVFASLSVAIQQPTAIARAFAFIDPKYFVIGTRNKDSMFKGDTWEDLKKYAPVAVIKEMGYFDANVGQTTAQWLTAKSYDTVNEKAKAFFTDGKFRDDVMTWLPAKADEVTWCAIWNAVQLETQDLHSLKVGTEANKVKSGERFTEIISMTQVYDSVFSRNQLMRNENLLLKMATAFMSEPTTSLNLLVDGVFQAKNGGAEGKKYCARAVVSFILSSVLVSVAKSFITAARDDDEDKTYAEAYAGEVVANILSELFIPNMMPFVKDFFSLVQGYDVERADMSLMSDVVYAFKKLNNDNITAGKKILEVTKAISALFGIPLKNISRDVQSFINVIKKFLSDNETTDEGVLESIEEALEIHW